MLRIVAVAATGCLAVAASCLAADKPARPVIEDTYVIAPRLIGDYLLTGTVNYGDQGDLIAGVGLRYHDALLPMTADLYVYPGGGNETIEHAERIFRASVKRAVKLGLYSDVRWGETEDYKLQRSDGEVWQGRMIPMQVHHKEGDAASRTYLFHHDLYDYKLRVDVPASLGAQLPAAADGLLRSVLATLQVVSTGSCGKQLTINVLKGTDGMPPGYKDGVSQDGFGIAIREADLQPATTRSTGLTASSKSLLGLTLIAARRQIVHGCTSFPYKPPSGNVTVLKLHYPANFWVAGPNPPQH